MVLYILIYYLVLFFIPLIIYLLLFKQQNTDWYYTIKYYIARIKVSSKKDLIKEETENENHLIKGIDQYGNYVILKLIVKENGITDSTILLNLNKKIYQQSKIDTSRQLDIQVLEPFRKLRILYNGLLLNDNGNLEHFQLNFIWTCAGKPFFHPNEVSSNLFADALARLKWRNGNWINLLPMEQYYEQYGALKGRITRQTSTVEINLASYRKCFHNTAYQFDKDLSVFAAAEDGTVFNLGVKSYRHSSSIEVKYGTLILNNGKVLSLNGHDFNLNEEESIPNVFVVHFNAGKDTFKSVIHLDDFQTTKGKNGCNIPFECNFNIQQAKGLFSLWQETTECIKQASLLHFNEKSSCLYVKSLSDNCVRNVKFAGGKASSLAALNALKCDNKFTVPPGIVVSAAAFQFQISENNEIEEVLKQLEDDEDLEEICKRAIKIISTTKIHDVIRENIVVELAKIYNNDNREWSWAVRSSAVGEDSSELSAAGQNSTFLGCKTQRDIFEALTKCWASSYSYKSVQYRKHNGLPVKCDVAVIIQKMVNASCAGVLFTCEPTNGNPLYMVITSNYGLGESVVSGTTEPDTIVLQRDFNNNKLHIHSEVIGSKKVKIIMKSDSGIESEEVNEKEGNVLCLTHKQIFQLGSVAWIIEKSFGYPLDIEWAFEKDDLFILQARPVTTLNAWNEFELLHEFDSAILSEEDTFLTKANVGEVIPGALTVLSRTTIASSLFLAVEKCAGIHLNRFTERIFSYQQHHGFIQFINMFSQTYGQNDVLTNQALDLSVFGHLVRNEKIASIAVKRFGLRNKWEKFKYILNTLKLVWIADETLKKAIEMNKTISTNIKPTDNSAIIHKKFRKYLEETFFEIALCHSIVSTASVFFQFVALSILTRDYEVFTSEHYHDISLLFSGDGNVVSADIPKKLQQLARAIVLADLSDQFLLIPSENCFEFLRKQTPKIHKDLCNFLIEQGHRSLREFELQSTTWAADTKKLIDIIKHHIKTNSFIEETSQLKLNTVDETIKKLITPKNNTTRKLLKFVMKKSRKAVARREATKSELIRAVDTVRKAYVTLANKLKIEGKLPDVELIFHLSDYEIGEIIENHTILIKKSLLRRRLYPKWDSLKFLEISQGIPIPLQEVNITNKSTLKEVQGTPVCMGEVEGRACVINNIEDANQIQQGDILITYCTDTAWSLYFPVISGIVTELGGLISHGAVVAREFCLPCIVGAENATKAFKTGDTVRLSATKGVLCLIK